MEFKEGQIMVFVKGWTPVKTYTFKRLATNGQYHMEFTYNDGFVGRGAFSAKNFWPATGRHVLTELER